MDSLRGRTVALVVTGSIAAYKAVELARLFVKAGASVLPVMTRSATEFVGATTLSGITGNSVSLDMWDPKFPGEMHIDLARRADAIVVVPATADILARFAQGRADDLATALVLSARGPVLAAPAMHPRMWEHPATQDNVRALLKQGRVTLVGPTHGEVANGEQGLGRMAEPEEIAQAVARALDSGASGAEAGMRVRDFAGHHIVVTAGPTVEDLDPVRFLGNRSSGKMGFAVAARAAARGAKVTLITGPVRLATPAGVRRIDVRGAVDMQAVLAAAMGADLSKADALVMSAAVADYRPRDLSTHKLKKQGDVATIELVRNPDLLADVGARRTGLRPVLVGFAVETGSQADVIKYARGKLTAKKVDLVVANAAEVALGADDNMAIFVTPAGEQPLARMAKTDLADRILDFVQGALGSQP